MSFSAASRCADPCRRGTPEPRGSPPEGAVRVPTTRAAPCGSWCSCGRTPTLPQKTALVVLRSKHPSPGSSPLSTYSTRCACTVASADAPLSWTWNPARSNCASRREATRRPLRSSRRRGPRRGRQEPDARGCPHAGPSGTTTCLAVWTGRPSRTLRKPATDSSGVMRSAAGAVQGLSVTRLRCPRNQGTGRDAGHETSTGYAPDVLGGITGGAAPHSRSGQPTRARPVSPAGIP